MNKLNVNLPALAAAALATTLVLGSTAAMADEVRVIERASSSAYQAPMARVISATPNIERFVETRQQCSEQVQQVTTQGSSNLGGVLVGSVIGGVAGSAIGKGTGKTIATATGAALGAQVARNYGEQPTTTNKVVQVCQPVNTVREQVRDYSVRYEWDGREYSVNLPQNPGPWLRVNTSHSVQMM
jgi:uncharacterized protein YcfJ